MSRLHGLARALARGGRLSAIYITLLLHAGTALAQDKEPLALLELGLASEQSLNGDGASVGPSVAVEFTAIKNWLEIEAAVQTLFGHGRNEWDTGLVFKKPFELSPTWELEPGIGPVWMHTLSGEKTTNAIGAEAVAHFVYWPSADRKFGWVFEPSYTYSFGTGHEQSIGFSVALVIPIR